MAEYRNIHLLRGHIARACYAETISESQRVGERNDCVPIALALTCNVPYRQVLSVCREHGREDGRGMLLYTRSGGDILPDLVKALGCRIERPVEMRVTYNRYGYTNFRPRFTVATVGKRYPKGVYLVRIRRHILAMVDGQVLDWTSGRRHLVTDVLEVLPR
jgi:hypothetical protein